MKQQANSNNLHRRIFLRRSFAVLAVAAFGAATKLLWDASQKNAPEEWDLSALEQLKPGDRVDLNTTLPKGLKRGGVFSVDPNSAPMPNQLKLSSEGILEVIGDDSWTVTGLIFSYQEP